MANRKYLFVFLYIFILIALFLAMVIPDLKNECIPNKKIAELSFFSFSKPTKDFLIVKMDFFKKEHRRLVQNNLYQDNFEQFLPPKGYVKEMEQEGELDIDGKKIYLSKNKMRWLSNNLMSPSIWDEQNVFRALYNFNPKKFDFNPHYFRYGGAWLYPMSLTLFLASKIGIFKIVKDLSYYMYYPNNILLMSITGKTFGIICYIIAILILFIITTKFYNLRTFIISAFFMTFCPGIIVETVYLKPILSSLMWYILGIFFIFRILEDEINLKSNSIYAGLCAGLASGSLIPSASILLPILIALTYNRIFPLQGIKERIFKGPYNDIKYFIFSVTIFSITFFATNPYILFSYKEFIREMFWNVQYYSYYSLWDYKIHLQNIIIFLNGLSWPFGLLIFVSLGWVLFKKHDRKNIIILFAILTYYLWGFSTCFALDIVHALLPIIPFLILLSAQFLDYLFQEKILNRYILYTLISIIALYTFLNSLFYVFMLQNQPRVIAGEWINKNISEGSTIGTFIDNSGLSYNYPYFNYFKFHFINDSDFRLSKIKKELPQYYIMVLNYLGKVFTCPADQIPLEYKDYIDKNTKGTRFRWAIKMNEEKEVESYYKKIAEFRTRVWLLDKIFRNNLLFWWTKEIKIYKLR